MDVGVVHDLPTGGALRVLTEWCAHTSADRVTVYARDASVHAFAPLPVGVDVVDVPTGGGDGILGEARRLATSPRDGARLAARVDAAGHDVVLCFASRLTQAPDVLGLLRTPSVFYAPEPLRVVHETKPLMYAEPGWRVAVGRAGLNPLEWRRRQLDRRAMRRAPRVVTHSAFTQATLRAAYGVGSVVVPLGVDTAAFTPGEGARDGSVLAVGALHPLKGHELVVDAVGRIDPARRPPLVIIGDRGWAEAALRERAASAGVALELLQAIPFAEVVARYQRAGVVACGQIREPFGLVPLEAMACRAPVVAVDDGGFRETIRDQQTGLLVPGPRDPMTFAATLERVLTDPDLAGRLGRAGRDAVLSDWTWERSAAAFDAELRAAYAGPPDA